jgi:Mce-associated membrane protein
MTTTSAPSSTLARPFEDDADDDLLSRWRHAGGTAGGAPGSDVEPAAADATTDTDQVVDPPADDAPAGTDQPAGHRAGHGAGPRWRRAVAGAVVLAVAAAAAWFAYQDYSRPSTGSAQAAAAKAAQSDAVALSTYRYTDLDGFFGSVKSFSTAGFSSSFTKGAQSLVKILTQYKAVSTGKVASFGVTSFGGGKASVLVMVDQTVANSATKTPTAETEAFEFGMVEQGGRWLLNAETAVH